MKYKSFNLTNFIGLKYFSPESIAELKGENEKYEQSKKSKTLNQAQTKVTSMQVRCAKCKKNCSKKPENCVYSYSIKKKDYKKLFLCEDCSIKCRKCNKISKTGIFVYIWNKSKNDYSKHFYCMDCYKKANLKQCAKCKKSVDSEVIDKPIISAKKSKIIIEEKQKRKELIKEKLEAWSKANEPLEGWYFEDTDDKIKEIKLRRKYLREKSKILWLDYLGRNGLKVNRKIAVTKDNPELLSMMNELRSTDISQLENSKFCQSIKKLRDIDMSNLSVNKISNFIENLKNAFETSKKELNATDSIVMLINATIDVLGKINPNDNKNYVNEEKELTSILTQLETIN